MHINFIGLDPATVSGFVRLDAKGNVLEDFEIKNEKKVVGSISIDEIIELEDILEMNLSQTDFVAVEATVPNSFRAMTTGMVHGGLKSTVRRTVRLPYIEVSPLHLKQYVGVKGRIPKNKKKQVVIDAVKQMYNYTHESHNVVDAFVLAQISRDYFMYKQGYKVESRLTDDQMYVLRFIEKKVK